MANKYSGSYRHLPRRTNARGNPYGSRGVARMVREQKCREALDRAAQTPHERTKHHRLRCTAETCIEKALATAVRHRTRKRCK